MAYLGSTPARAPLSSAQIEDGTIDTADLATNAVTTAKITDANITAAKVSSDVAQLGKNRLHNGAMAVAQRASQTGVASGYGACDRWEMNSLGGASARYTLSQESSGGVGGNAKWAKVLVTTADASPGANEAHFFGQKIEGFNAQSLLDDSGDLLASTMSFDVVVHADGASSISFPATLAICVNDNGFGNQQYVKTFTVTSADTWQRVSVPIAANTSIVINNDNTNQFQVAFTIYSGTARETSNATWGSASGADVSVSGVDNLADATNNYLGITNVQLEVGSVATDFEPEPFSVTFAKCLRYYFELAGADQVALPTGSQTSTTAGSAYFQYLVEMRTTPTLAYSDLSHFGVQPDMAQQNPDSITLTYGTASSAWIQHTFSADAAKGLTYRFYTLSASARLNFSADL
jgi:hypothetical protein